MGVTVRGAGVGADPGLHGVGESTAAAKTAEAELFSALPGGLVFFRCSSGVLRSRRSIPLVRGVTGSDDDCVFSVGCWKLSSTVTPHSWC